MDEITKLKARLFDINSAISNLQAEGQQVLAQLKEAIRLETERQKSSK